MRLLWEQGGLLQVAMPCYLVALLCEAACCLAQLLLTCLLYVGQIIIPAWSHANQVRAFVRTLVLLFIPRLSVLACIRGALLRRWRVKDPEAEPSTSCAHFAPCVYKAVCSLTTPPQPARAAGRLDGGALTREPEAPCGMCMLVPSASQACLCRAAQQQPQQEACSKKAPPARRLLKQPSSIFMSH